MKNTIIIEQAWRKFRFNNINKWPSMSTPINKNNFSKTARESRVECKREYQKNKKKNKKRTWQILGCNLPFLALPHLSTPHNQKNPPPSPFLLSCIYVSLPQKNTPNLLEENPLIPSFCNLLYFLIFFPFITDSPMEIIYVLSF